MTNSDHLIPSSSFDRKFDAETRKAVNEKMFGGRWSLSKVGRKWRLTHVMTKADIARRDAESTLSMSWWDAHGLSAVGFLKHQEDKLAKFTERLANDPLGAFEWQGTDAIQAAADVHVLRQMIHAHNNGRTDEEICRNFEAELDRMIRHDHLSNSSSPSVNLANHAKRIATAEYVGELRAFIKMQAEAMGDLYAIQDGLI